MGAIQHRICPFCGKSSGERFIDEDLPCPHCKNDYYKANVIKKKEKKENVLFWLGLISITLFICFLILSV